MSLTELKEYFVERRKIESRGKAEYQNAYNYTTDEMEAFGLKDAKDELEQNTIVPPENLWSKESLSYQIHDRLGLYYLLISKAHYDLRDNIEKFTPTAEIQKEHKEHFLRFRDRVIVPLANIDSYIMKFHKIMMDHITDEKYGDTFLNWLKISEDKFWSAGNHGSGEINSILTGKYIGKFKTNESQIQEAIELGEEPPAPRYVVVETPLEREFTREQIADVTKFQFGETAVLHCSYCKAENYYKVVPVEISDSVFGDWLNKARTSVEGSDLENMIETVADHVAIRQLRSPIDILKQHKKNVTDEDISYLELIMGQPENMKEVEIDSKAIVKMGYNMLYGRAGRRANKAEHFSDNA